MIDAWLDLLHGGCCAGCLRPGRSWCDGCEQSLPDLASEVRPTPCPEGLVRCFAAGEYDGVLRNLVLAHKERAVYALAEPLAHCLAVSVARVASPYHPTLLVPVPSTASVVRQRGHDPLLRVVRRTTRLLDRTGEVPVVLAPLLAARSSVADQAGLDAEARRRNRRHSMRVLPHARERLARTGQQVAVVVVDDVLTTGSTAREAQRALQEAGIAVRAIAVVAATRRRLPSGPSAPRV